MANRPVLFQKKAIGGAHLRWRGRALALAGFVLPAFAGRGEPLLELVPESRVIGATVAVHGSAEAPAAYERQELVEQGLSLDVPKGWSRNDEAGVVTFEGRWAAVRVRTVALHARSGGLNPLQLADSEVRHLGGGKPAKLRRMKEIDLPAGNAVLLKFRINSGTLVDPLSSLECSVYVFRHSEKLQILSVWSSTASDHRALRRRVAESLRWK